MKSVNLKQLLCLEKLTYSTWNKSWTKLRSDRIYVDPSVTIQLLWPKSTPCRFNTANRTTPVYMFVVRFTFNWIALFRIVSVERRCRRTSLSMQLPNLYRKGEKLSTLLPLVNKYPWNYMVTVYRSEQIMWRCLWLEGYPKRNDENTHIWTTWTSAMLQFWWKNTCLCVDKRKKKTSV